MLEFLPQEVRDGLDAARRKQARRSARLRVMLGGETFPILRFWDDGFSVDAGQAARLRGSVDIFDGARHVVQGLIIATTVENGELICEFKRSTMVSDRAPLDFWQDENRPMGYLPKA
jgi:hypothetical protein